MNGAIQGTWKVVIAAVLAAASVLTAQAQRRPYLGYAYPAGGQQGTTFEVKLGGQDLDDLVGLAVTGGGATVRVTDYQRKIGPQEVQLLQLPGLAPLPAEGVRAGYWRTQAGKDGERLVWVPPRIHG